MAYKLTAADRRALAQMQARERQRKNGYRAVTTTAQKSQAFGNNTAKPKNDEKNILEKGVATWFDTGKNLWKGVGKAYEGIIDLGAGLVGAAGGLISDDFQENIRDFIEVDWTSEVFDNQILEKGIDDVTGIDLRQITGYDKYSYWNDYEWGDTVQEVVQGVGQMLPSVAVAIGTAGLGTAATAAGTGGKLSALAAKAAPLATKHGAIAMMGAQAAGNATEEAFNDGAGYYQGLGYGALSGATEIVTERLIPGPADMVTGKTLLPRIFGTSGKVADQGIKRVIKQGFSNAINEGFEEMVSEVTNPLRKTIYKGKDALKEYEDGEFWKGVGKAGVTGALTSVAFTPVGSLTNKALGRNADIDVSVQKISKLSQNRDSEVADNDNSNRERYKKNIEDNFKQIEAVLKKASDTNRAKYIESYELGKYFDSDGTYKAGSGSDISFNKNYYSADFDGYEAVIEDDIKQLNEIDETNISIYDGELSEAGRKHYTKLKKMINALNNRGKKHLSLGIVDSSAKFNGVTVDGERVYIRADVLESSDWANTPIHEVKHVGEGTKASTTLMELLESDKALMKKAQSEVLGADDYGFDKKTLRDILIKKNRGEAVTAEEALYYSDFSSEKGATAVEMFLGDEAFVDKIIRLDAGLAEKLVGKWQDMKAAIKSFESKESREKYKRLVKAQKLFLEAAETAGDTRLANIIQGLLDDEEETVDSEAKVQYNRNKTYKQISKQEYAIISSRIMEDNSKYMARNDELPKYAAARSADYFYVYENFAPGHFGVLKQIKITDANRQYTTSIEKQLGENNGKSVITSTNELNRVLEILKNQSRRNSRHNVNDSRGQADSGNGGVSSGKSAGKPTGNNGESAGNQRTVKKSTKIQHSYAGKGAKTADMTLLERAEAMETEGAESEAIRKETGWFRSFDNEWRYEIDDSKMRYLNPTPDAEGFTTLGELIEHDALFEAYPQLEDLKVEFKEGTKYNYYSPGRKKIVLMESVFENGDFKPSEDKKLNGKSILIHEIQHALQHIEGFARGTSPAEWRKRLREMRIKTGEYTKLNTAKQIAKISEMYGEEIGQDAREYIDLVLLDWKNQAKKRDIERLELLEIGLEMILGDNFEIIEKALIGEAKWVRSIKSIAGDAEINYYNTAGEIEAYDVGERVDLDSETRRAVRPDIDRNPDDVKFANRNSWRKMHGEERSEAEDYSEYDKPITIKDVQVLRSIGRKSINEFTSEDIKKARKWAYKFYKELGVKSPFFRAWFGDWRAYDKKTPVEVTDIPKYKLFNQRQNVVCDDTGWTIRISGHGERNTRAHAGGEYLSVKGLNNIVELIKNAVLFDTEIHEHHDNNAPNEMIAFDHKLYALGKDVNDSVALYKITIEDIYQSNTQPDDLRFHNLRYVKEIEKVVENTSGSSDQIDQPYTAKRSFSTTTYSISQLFDFVKRYDKEFRPNSVSEHLIDKGTGLPKVFEHTVEDGSSIKVFKNGAGQIKSAETGIDANIGTFDRGTKKIQYSRKLEPKRSEAEEKGITANSTNAERTKILKTKQITNIPVCETEEIPEIQSWEDIDKHLGKEKRAIIKKVANEYGVFKEYTNEDIDVTFKFSGNGFDESYSKQKTNYSAFGKMFSIFDDVVSKAVGIEVHNRNIEGYKTDPTLENVYVLMSAFVSGDLIYPVKLEIKEFKDKPNTLYVAITLNGSRIWTKKETGVSGSGSSETDVAQNSRPVNISISDLMKKVNPKNTNFTKYFPRELLTRKQKHELEFVKLEKENALFEEKEIVFADLLRMAEDFDNLEKGRFFSASVYKGETLKKIPGVFRTGLRNAREVTGGIRKSLIDVKNWYTAQDNGMFFRNTDESEFASTNGLILYDEDVAAFLEEICDGEGALTLDELKKLDKIASYFLKVNERYKKVYIEGNWVDAEEVARQKVDIMLDARKNQTYATNAITGKYLRQFGDPSTLARCADGYNENGFWQYWFDGMRQADVNIGVDEMNTLRPYREWYQTHKKWGTHLEKDTVSFRGQKIPIQKAMALYCSFKDAKSQQALADNGFLWKEGKKNDVKEGEGLIEQKDPINKKNKKNTKKAVKKACEAAEKELWEIFSEEEKQYIQMLEKILNEDCRGWKIDTDELMRGFSLVRRDGGYYFPTLRAQVKKTVNAVNYEGDRVAHLSSNKHVVEGARGAILLESIDDIVLRHVHNTLLYKHYGIIAENISMLMNIDVGDNVHNPETLKSIIEKGGKNSTELLKVFEKMSKDLQGVPKGEKAEQQFMYEMINTLRSGYAVFVLSLNPKVLLSQLSSIIASGHIFDIKSIFGGLKGLVSKGAAEEVAKYCPIAELRRLDNTAAKAQGVLDKVRGVGEFLMKLVGYFDSKVICAEWHMAQHQIESDMGLKFGTEENKIEAGKLLTKVILETQQNTFVTESSEAMRGGEGVKWLTMFSRDGMKSTGRWLDSIGNVSILKRKLKNCTDETQRKILEEELKKANAQLVKSTSVVVSQAIYMALIAWFFRFLYDKDEEELGEELKNVGADTFGNMLGGLPILRDVYSLFSDGYEVENFALSTVNDVLIASGKAFNLAADAAQGKDITKQEVASSIRNVLYSAGQVMGIPVRNTYNLATGLTRRIFPSAGYNIDNLFYKQSYSSDLKKAIENNDEDMIETITGLILDESLGAVSDKTVRSEVSKLSAAGYSVLPRSIGDKVTYDGEEITLTKKQKARFKELYAVGNQSAAELVKLQLYKKADDQAKAKALRFIYDTYYNLALQEALGVDLEGKNVLFAEALDIEQLAIIVGIAGTIEADKDRKGNVISGSRKAKLEKYVESLPLKAAQKYMIMGYLGYKNKNGEAQVKAYINRLKLTKDEKAQLLEYSGYAA